MSKAKKILLGGGISIVALIIIIALIVGAFLGSIVKVGVEKALPPITGTRVSLGSVGYSLIGSSVTIKDFVIYNPEGYKSEYAFKLGELHIDVDVGSLFSDKIVINKFLVDGMNVCYEQGLTTSNIYEIKKNVDKFGEAGAKAAKEEDKKKEPAKPGEGATTPTKQKRFQIGSLDFQNNNVIILTKISGQAAVKAPMPPIHMKNLGMDNKEGDTAYEMAPKIFLTIVKSTVQAVRDSSVDVGSKTLDSLEKGASGVIDGVKSFFK